MNLTGKRHSVAITGHEEDGADKTGNHAVQVSVQRWAVKTTTRPDQSELKPVSLSDVAAACDLPAANSQLSLCSTRAP